MTPRQMQIEFETRLYAANPQYTYAKLFSFEIEKYLNQALDKWFVTRYTGVNAKGEGFEQSEKRLEDLQSLVKSHVYTQADAAGPYQFAYPPDLVFVINDECKIKPRSTAPQSILDCWEKEPGTMVNGTCTCEYKAKSTTTLDVTHLDLNHELLNPMSPHRFRFGTGEPLRVTRGKNIYLYTDDSIYYPSSYTIYYLTKPTKIDLHKVLGSNTTSLQEYTDIPEYAHMEIIQMALTLYNAA